MSVQRFDVVVVGAGFGGIGAAIQLKKLGYENILIVDRENDLGGTWHVNRYPGLAVDIPSTTYCYWFEPNPYWSRVFAPGDEIKRYADHVADKYDVRRHMRFNTAVDGVQWDEDARIWRVALADGHTLSTRFLITATGILSQPNTPDLPGINEFAGRIIHTTAWDDSYDFEGRCVGVIGTGATAVQLIPELAKKAADLTVYQRTPIHVVAKNDFPIPVVVQRLFARVPVIQHAFRWVTDTIYELMFVLAVLNYRNFGWLNLAAEKLSTILRFVSIRDKELRRKLTPDYDFGCKRPRTPIPTTGPSPSRTCICRRPASSGSSQTASARLTGRNRRSTRWCWPPVSICGRPTSPRSRLSAAKAATLESGGARTDSRPTRGCQFRIFPTS